VFKLHNLFLLRLGSGQATESIVVFGSRSASSLPLMSILTDGNTIIVSVPPARPTIIYSADWAALVRGGHNAGLLLLWSEWIVLEVGYGSSFSRVGVLEVRHRKNVIKLKFSNVYEVD
jgi:hypothetical protein